MFTFHQITSFLNHKLYEINDHSLHSPGLFKFYQNCFKTAKKSHEDPLIEALRKKFGHDRTLINIVDYGAGSRIVTKSTRSVRSIVNGGISTSKYSRLFQQLIRYFNFKHIVELGTSLGINTLYLAKAATDVKVWTFEGSSSIADIADQAFHDLGCSNIEMIQGNIASSLSAFLNNVQEIDFVFIDASHTYQATIDYFNMFFPKLSKNAVVVVDDIYWSKGMTRAWKDINQGFPEIASIDIYQCGMLLLDKSFKVKGLKLAY